ncbi:MAG: DHHW family protein [Lachnospiraceae bacterium]
MKKINFNKNQIAPFVTIIIFLVLIFGGTATGFFHKDRLFSETENRFLEQKPAITVKSFFEGKFATDYEKYITDQFFMRDNWIFIKTMAEMVVGKKDISGVYLSKDNYLLECHDDIDEEKAYKNADRMAAFVNRMAQEFGTEHVSIMIVPTATSILSDKLPWMAPSFDQNTYIDYIKEKTDGMFVDVRESLLSHKDEYIYYKTDHHWTSMGAYLAYRSFCDAKGYSAFDEEAFDVELAADDFLGTIYSKINYAKQSDEMYIYKIKEPVKYHVEYNAGEKESDSLFETEHLMTKDKYSVFLNGNNAVVTIDTKGGKEDGDTLLVIKDSYAHCFVPFAANHYKKIVMIDLRYLKMPVSRVIEEYGITDVLVLYNTVHFAKDTNLSLIEK